MSSTYSRLRLRRITEEIGLIIIENMATVEIVIVILHRFYSELVNLNGHSKGVTSDTLTGVHSNLVEDWISFSLIFFLIHCLSNLTFSNQKICSYSLYLIRLSNRRIERRNMFIKK